MNNTYLKKHVTISVIENTNENPFTFRKESSKFPGAKQLGPEKVHRNKEKTTHLKSSLQASNIGQSSNPAGNVRT